MFREMRKKEREVGIEEINIILDKGEYGVLATIGENGYPYATPLSYVHLNNKIYFHCATTGNKLDNIEHCSKVSFTVVGDTQVLPGKFTTEYESVVIFGHAGKALGEEKKGALLAIIDKYSKEFKTEGIEYINRAIERTEVVRIEIERVTGKARR